MSANTDSKFRQILGVRFFIGSAAEAVQIGLAGGLVVVPAAPALIELERDKTYREALLDADLAITDSGFMVLLWNILNFERITRVSGLEYLKALINEPPFRNANSTLWIMPTERSRDLAIEWLKSRRVAITPDDCYLAPHYNQSEVTDSALLAIVQRARPTNIVIALGGGTQEKLGHYLKQRAAYKPAIHCIGAAIGFLSGDQVNIPDWADRFFLGWVFRCFSQPAKFFPRYWKARRLLPLLLKNRDRLPTFRGNA